MDKMPVEAKREMARCLDFICAYYITYVHVSFNNTTVPSTVFVYNSAVTVCILATSCLETGCWSD